MVHQVGPPAPEGYMGQVWEGTSPRLAGAPPHQGPRRLGLGGNSKGGQGNPPGRRPLLRLDLKGGPRGWLAPKPSGAPPTPRVSNPRRGGRPKGGAPAHQGLVPLPLQPIRPSGRGGPSRWTPGTPPVAPVQYRYAPETFRRPYDNFPYINLYIRTIPEHLVTSGISSGTPNNIR